MPTAAPKESQDLRALARARAAQILDLPEDAIEDDLIDFIVLPGGDALLRARAGSGKSTALRIKVAFLTMDLGVDPSRIMMLTFNNAAARSLEQGLAAAGVPAGTRVRTFHALAQRIVRAHLGGSRTCVFDEKSPEARVIKQAMTDSLDEIATDPYFYFCASRIRRSYDKNRDFVVSLGRDALQSAVEFLRARGYGLQNQFKKAWDEAGPIGGNAMKAIMAYELRLKDEKLLDPTSTLQAASWVLETEIKKGVPRLSDAHEIDWIFIDEFQDVSLPYMRLVAAMREINGMINVMGVGDDWQAINGFAGADLDFFTNVSRHLEDPVKLDLLRNRRSGSKIVAWGNAVMADAGFTDAPAIPAPANGEGKVTTGRVSGSTDINFTAERLAARVDLKMRDVALIARRWKAGDHSLTKLARAVERELRKKGYEGKVSAITAHGSKGLEYDQVLLLDDGAFPLVHPGRPILEALISEGDYLREEACLKHVAGTRAKRHLDVINMS